MAEQAVHQILAERAASQPDDPVFTMLAPDGGAKETWSFSELNRRAQAVAAAITDKDLIGKPVLLVFPPGLDFVAALFGCFIAGAIAVPVPFMLAQRAFHRVKTIMESAKPVLGLTLSSLREMSTARQDLATLPALPWLDTDRLEPLESVARPPSLSLESVALLQYTSGTTSAPRGVCLTHANLAANLQVIQVATSLRFADRLVSWLPVHHDMGLMGFILTPIFGGQHCHLMSPVSFLQHPHRWLDAISRYQASHTSAPCFAYDLAARRSTPQQRAGLDLSNWRVAICGGEPVRAAVMENFARVFEPHGFSPRALFPSYGLAESTLLATALPVGSGVRERLVDSAALDRGYAAAPSHDRPGRRLVCCGGPWLGHEVACVDLGSGNRLAVDQVGEIWLKGPSVGAGYWDRPDATATSFGAHIAGEGGWFRTGDIGFLDSDGIYVTGRYKDLIIVRGANYEPSDLEHVALSADDGLVPGGAAAFAVDGPEGEVVVVAVEVERQAAKQIDGVRVGQEIVARISRQFGLTLHDLVLVKSNSLPRTTSGKIRRHACRTAYESQSLDIVVAPLIPLLGRHRPIANSEQGSLSE